MKMNYKPIMEAVLAAIKAAHSSSSIGFLPPVGGIAITYAGGDIKTDMTGNAFGNIRINVSAKSKDQSICAELIDTAHSAIFRMCDENTPAAQAEEAGLKWQIYGARVMATPTFAGQDQGQNWIMTSSILVHACSFKEGNS